MPRIQSAGSASTTTAQTPAAQALKRNQACHQCRKRKLKCNAQKPCATCAKSHKLAVASNPTLAGTEPECTYDEFTPEHPPPVPEGPRAKYQRLENRINELEALLKEQKENEAAANVNVPTSSSRSPPTASFSAPNAAGSPSNNRPASFSGPPNDHFTTIFTDDPSPFMPSVQQAHISPNPAIEDVGDQRLIPHDWPARLPAPDLLHHLIDLFFTCHPHAHYLLHRPTFMASLTFPPKSPAFPHSSLLHAICAYASVFSYRVHTPAIDPQGGVFPDRNSNENRELDNSFAEKHVRWSRQARDDATSIGNNLIECTQSLVIMVGYYHLTGRWVELWASAGLALRYCVPLGLNNRVGFHTARTHPRTWIRNGGRSILPDADNAIEREQRINLFWIAYSYERFQTAVGPWAMGLDDEDISQIFPCRLEDYEAGNDVDLNRQCMQTPGFLSAHVPETTDSFTLFIKAAVLLSKVKILTLRVGHRYPNIADVRDTPAFRHLESNIATFRSTFPPGYQEPILQTNKGFDTQLYVAHLIPHVAIILMHEEHANIDSPNCLSTQKSVLAARAILDLVYLICSTSYDIGRLPPVCTFCWFMSARVLVRVLKHKLQAGLRSEATTMRSEVEVIRLAYSRMGERIPLALRHGKMLDELLHTELTTIDETIYGTCTYEQIYDPAYTRGTGIFDFPSATLTEVETTATSPEFESTTASGSISSQIRTPEAGILADTAASVHPDTGSVLSDTSGPILTDMPTSASATLEQLLQSIDADSFLLASGYGDMMQFPLV